MQERARIILYIDPETHTQETELPLTEQLLNEIGQETNEFMAHVCGYESWEVTMPAPSRPMSVEDARKVQRTAVEIGKHYTFYSDCVECKTDHDTPIRRYSGQTVAVVADDFAPGDEGWDDDESLRTYVVEANDGVKFTANEGELNGWIFDTGQWVGPRVN